MANKSNLTTFIILILIISILIFCFYMLTKNIILLKIVSRYDDGKKLYLFSYLTWYSNEEHINKAIEQFIKNNKIKDKKIIIYIFASKKYIPIIYNNFQINTNLRRHLLAQFEYNPKNGDKNITINYEVLKYYEKYGVVK